jgi:hypothetical protein
MEAIKYDREAQRTQRTTALPSASTLRPYSGWLLSSRQIYTKIEVEPLKRYRRSINQLKTQWPTDAFHLELSTPKCFRDTNRMSIGIPYDRVTTQSAYHRERIWSRHACFCSSAPSLETSSHLKAVVTFLLDDLPSFTLPVAHLRPPIVENYFHNCVEYRLLVVMSNALEDALVARDRRLYRPDPLKVGGRRTTGTTVSQGVLSVSSRWRDTIKDHVQI